MQVELRPHLCTNASWRAPNVLALRLYCADIRERHGGSGPLADIAGPWAQLALWRAYFDDAKRGQTERKRPPTEAAFLYCLPRTYDARQSFLRVSKTNRPNQDSMFTIAIAESRSRA